MTDDADTRLAAEIDPIETPECDKLAALHDQRMPIADFLEWLDCEGYVIARYREGHNYPDQITRTSDDLLMEHLQIDTKKLEKERRAILSAYQKVQGG
jgi:hypothetical protein